MIPPYMRRGQGGNGSTPGGQTGTFGNQRTQIGSLNAAVQRAANAEAPHIPHLFRRICLLFQPHTRGLVATGILVLVSAGIAVVPPLLTVRVFDEGLFPLGNRGPNVSVLCWLVGAMLVLFAVNALLQVWQTWLTASIGNKVMGALRVRLFSHLQSMELGFFTRTKTGIIQSRLQNDVGGVASVLTNTVASVLGNTVTVGSALIAMLAISWQLTLVAVVLLPAMVVAQRKVGQVRARIANETQESLSELTAITQEALSVSGIMLSKSFSRQGFETARYESENANQVRLQVRQSMSGQWFFALVSTFLAAVPAIVYLIAGWLVGSGEGFVLTAGVIVGFTTVQSRMLFPLIGLMRVGLDVQTSGALFARIFEYLDLQPMITTSAEARPVPPGANVGRVTFAHVSFRYPESDPAMRPTLDDVSFVVEPGQYAAFVGPSGAGKTTVSYLVPRLYEATSGVVSVAGVDVRDLDQESLIGNVGIVSQETYLFHATIADNLRYAKPDATLDELERAARAANIHDAIMSFPDGYDTVVGERGYRLSGGEKQRVAIARVLLKNPPVLVLDEATSALDTTSERIVQHALDDAARGRTTIAIAHRLSTVVHADVIFVVAAGRIVERGSHSELLAAGGMYAALYQEQAGTGPVAADGTDAAWMAEAQEVAGSVNTEPNQPR